MPALDRTYFARLSRELMGEATPDLTLQAVVQRAVEVIPGCDFAGVSLRRRRAKVTTVAATHQIVETCDGLQYQLGEGPCLDAIWHGDLYLANDLAHDTRWSLWGPQVSELGAQSILAIRISDNANAIGALNLYSGTRHAYDDEATDVAVTFGYHAANALVSSRLEDGLRSSLQSRHTIGLAQGILMATYALNAQQAFNLLLRVSSEHQLPVRDIAVRVVADGSLPQSSPTKADGPATQDGTT